MPTSSTSRAERTPAPAAPPALQLVPPAARRRSGRPAGAFDVAIQILIVVGLLTLVWLTFTADAFSPLLREAGSHRWIALFKRPALLWAAMGFLLLSVRTALWLRYRPAAPATMADAPSLTVVIPAYNEGAMVAQSIDSVAAASYPPGKLTIFAVDDGSRDDTWEHIQRAARRHPGLVTALRLPRNMGKRRALAEGFRRAKGEILVTIDSDSVIEPDALLALAGPFRESRVGAVAGNVAVLNRRAGIIPRMLAVRFVLTFDFLRAVQSTYGNVYCCPGALTAYRASALRAVLDRWLTESFLGVPCTFGEDRAMTNLLLASGFDTLYQRTAVVHTIVPETYGRLCKMFLRWDRSYIREEIRYARIVWSRPPRARLLSLLETALNNLRYPVLYTSLVLLVALAALHPLVLLRFALAVGLFSFFNMLYYLRSERSVDFLYGVLYAYFAIVALVWIFPYAVLTVRARGWLTR
jgi:hyaluronan synthase